MRKEGREKMIMKGRKNFREGKKLEEMRENEYLREIGRG